MVDKIKWVQVDNNTIIFSWNIKNNEVSSELLKLLEWKLKWNHYSVELVLENSISVTSKFLIDLNKITNKYDTIFKLIVKDKKLKSLLKDLNKSYVESVKFSFS